MSTQMSNDVGELVERLVVAEVAGCTCHIKTPEIAYHASNCHYRLFREAWTEIERLNKWADGFSDAQLKERRLAEERIAELATALSSQAAEIAELRKALEKIAAPYAGEDDTLLIPLALIGAELRKRQSIARAALTRKEG